MAEEKDPFFERFNRFTFAKGGGGIIVTLILALFLVGGSAYMAYATASGSFFQELKPVRTIDEGHTVRRHGWGGIYIIPGYRGRSHFGGGGSIH